MKLDSFVTLDAVLRGGTLAAAAAEAHLTPSAVSMQMKQLEAWLGQPLFDRSGLQVRPTRLAHEVGALMREALGQLEALRKRPSVRIEGQYVPVNMSPQRQKRRLFQVLMQSLEAFAAAGPFLLVVEDLHWIDPTTMELLVLLVNQVATMRLFALLTTLYLTDAVHLH